MASEHSAPEGYVIRFSRIRGLTHPKLLRRSLRFPNGPLDSVRQGASFNHGEYQTIRLGTFSRPGGRELRTVSFTTLLTDWPLPVATYPDDEQEPLDFLTRLRRIMATGTPFWLHMGTPSYSDDWDVSMAVTLRSVEAEERAGELDTRYVDLSLVEYRKASVKGRKKGRKEGHRSHTPATVTVRKDGTARGIRGQVTLAKLARDYYGSTARWRPIARANQGALVKGIPPNETIHDWVARKNGGHPREVKIKVPQVVFAHAGAEEDDVDEDTPVG